MKAWLEKTTDSKYKGDTLLFAITQYGQVRKWLEDDYLVSKVSPRQVVMAYEVEPLPGAVSEDVAAKAAKAAAEKKKKQA